MKYLALALLALSAAPLPAARIFQVKVNTPTLVGDPGYVDFQFNSGGADADAGSATITLFSGATPGTDFPIGDVTGSLPGTVTINNTPGLNDLFQAVTFGSEILFRVTIDGPVLNSFDPLSTSGSTFTFSMFADDQVTPLLTNDPAGFALTIDVGPLGALTVNDLSQRGVIELAEVPEPSTAALLLTGAALIAARLRRRR